MKKVAFIMYSNLSMVGGTEKVVKQYCKNAPLDWEITIVQMNEPSGQSKDFDLLIKERKINIYTIKNYENKLSFLNSNIATRFLNQILFYPMMFRLLKLTAYRSIWDKIGKPDVVYLFNNQHWVLFPKESKIVGTTHAWAPDKSSTLKQLIATLARSGIFWRGIKYFHTFEKFKWFIEGSRFISLDADIGVDTSLFFPDLNNDDKSVNLIFFARLVECKGVMIIKKAMEIVNQTYNLKIGVSGVGPLVSEIDSDPQIQYYGYLDDSNLSDLLRKSSCYVYPTRCDTFALSVMESLASGLYVITSSILRGVYDKFEEIGILEYCSLEPEDIAERILNFIKIGVGKEIITKSVRLINEKYSWEVASELLFNWFSWINTDENI